MQFLPNLLYIKRPSLQTLLDITLLLSILPHIFVLKSFMLIYVGVSLFFILKRNKDRFDSLYLFVIGVICITLSFFSNYNFSDFSRMQFFVSLISSLLILAVTLQRTTGQINFYLKASPVMLMMLSFFFFNTIFMLSYSVFVFFIFILFNIWSRMDTSFGQLLKFTLALFMLALPLVVILFISFPRISFKKAEFGFRSDQYTNSTFSGSMNVSNTPFISSNNIVMEVYFHEQIPLENQLYFRTSTLYPGKKYEWNNKINMQTKEYLQSQKEIVSYNLLIYPHAKQWVYPLQIPTDFPKNTILQKDYTLKSKNSIYKQKHYKLKSSLNYILKTTDSKRFLDFDPALYPKTFETLKSLGQDNSSVEIKAAKLLKIFHNLKISYTTSPKNLNQENIIDSFMFEVKNGYCTHFASAFAIAARIVGIPSRVVTGYKGSYKNKVENYIIIKEEDAHAWVELYLPENGWTLFEPTATAYKNLDITKKQKEFKNNEFFLNINKQYMYIQYLINNWILNFDRVKQVAILNALLNNTIYLLQFVFSIIAVILLSVMLFYFIRSWSWDDSFTKEIKKLLKTLEKEGILKQKNETMEEFFKRVEIKFNISFDRINKLYHAIKYSKNKDFFQELKQEIIHLKKKIANIKK